MQQVTFSTLVDRVENLEKAMADVVQSNRMLVRALYGFALSVALAAIIFALTVLKHA